METISGSNSMYQCNVGSVRPRKATYSSVIKSRARSKSTFSNTAERQRYGGDLREHVVQRVVGRLRDRAHAAEGVGVVGVHERVDKRQIRAERTTNLDGVVRCEPPAAGELNNRGEFLRTGRRECPRMLRTSS